MNIEKIRKWFNLFYSKDSPEYKLLKHIESMQKIDCEFESHSLIKSYNQEKDSIKRINLVGFTHKYSSRMVEFINEFRSRGEIKRMLTQDDSFPNYSSQLNLHLLDNIMSLDSVAFRQNRNEAKGRTYCLSLEQISLKEGRSFHRTRDRNIEVKKETYETIAKSMLKLYLDKYEAFDEQYVFAEVLYKKGLTLDEFSKDGYDALIRDPAWKWCGYNIIIGSPEIIPLIDSFFKKRRFKIKDEI